jgi:hypothetical protein
MSHGARISDDQRTHRRRSTFSGGFSLVTSLNPSVQLASAEPKAQQRSEYFQEQVDRTKRGHGYHLLYRRLRRDHHLVIKSIVSRHASLVHFVYY